MRRLYNYIEEGLLAGEDTTLSRGESDLNTALGIPTLNDFIFNSSGNSVYWECEDRLRKYNGYSWCPRRSSGLQFSVGKHKDLGCWIEIRLCEADTKFASYYAKPLKGWHSDKWDGKPVSYLKKVVISLIEHLAKNPKALDELLNYNAEVYKDIACKQSYDDGRNMPRRGLDELLKIKG